MTDRECLEYIRETYGAMIRMSALSWGHRPEVLAGIMCRETRGGTSALLDVQGPAGRGDGGHGHGLMQIDDRSFPAFCASDQWRDPRLNIDYGARVLFEKRTYLALHAAHHRLDNGELERASIAAYNCGQRNVMRALDAGLPVDHYTAHRDYSAKVLEYAGIYQSLDVTLQAESLHDNGQKSGFNLFALIAKLFGRKS